MEEPSRKFKALVNSDLYMIVTWQSKLRTTKYLCLTLLLLSFNVFMSLSQIASIFLLPYLYYQSFKAIRINDKQCSVKLWRQKFESRPVDMEHYVFTSLYRLANWYAD